jgi:hypothetical protein
MNYVQVFKSPTGWNVRYVSGPRVDLIKQLFGTDVLPLPYTLELSLEQATEKFVQNTRHAKVLNSEGGVVIR